jgi:tetratricopeptide (TPR) repeat protein
LYQEYASFNCDSAFGYAEKLQQVARQAKDRPGVAYAGMKLGFVLLSSGRFKEAFDTLRVVDFNQLSTGHKAEYYTLMARCYYDLADYNLDQVYAPVYNEKATSYLDSALVLFPDTSYQYTYYLGLQQIRTQNLNAAASSLKKLLARPELTLHQVAVTASTLSDVYIRKTQTDTAIGLLAQAAIADIQSATKETAAIFHLATLLFRQGDVKNASTFIQKSADDARYYGSRQRKAQFGSILPLIESQKINQVESERTKIFTYAVLRVTHLPHHHYRQAGQEAENPAGHHLQKELVPATPAQGKRRLADRERMAFERDSPPGKKQPASGDEPAQLAGGFAGGPDGYFGRQDGPVGHPGEPAPGAGDGPHPPETLPVRAG